MHRPTQGRPGPARFDAGCGALLCGHLMRVTDRKIEILTLVEDLINSRVSMFTEISESRDSTTADRNLVHPHIPDTL